MVDPQFEAQNQERNEFAEAQHQEPDVLVQVGKPKPEASLTLESSLVPSPEGPLGFVSYDASFVEPASPKRKHYKYMMWNLPSHPKLPGEHVAGQSR
eukprot:TRINITY_DN38745_c0_g1_i1.p1 TRINITY_DN38745_c0_g1~~TRINITY_DN38745_c0_g1_i1.p1  ORF type:complete len:108 (-),score=7.04 TRINITY_DN38745_c0_g1_i1:102-392(-)